MRVSPAAFPQEPAVSPYQTQISRQNKACFLFLLDQSYSMEEPLGNSTGRKMEELIDGLPSS